MWAIIDIKSKQYRVKEGDVVDVDYLGKDQDGLTIFVDKVLLAASDSDVQIGQPYLNKVNVQAQVDSSFKDEKIIVYTYKRRKGFEKKRGHRQLRTRLKILKIEHKA